MMGLSRGFSKRKIGKVFFAAVVSIAELTSAGVVDSNWIGGDGSWQDSTHWNPSAVPNNGANTYNVTVDVVGITASVRSNVTIASLTVGGSSIITVDQGALHVNGTVNNSGTLIANNKAIYFGGTYNTTATGSVASVNNGTVYFSNIANTGQSLNLSGTTHAVLLGTVTDGTITVAPSADFRTTYFQSYSVGAQHFNNVTLNGKLYMEAATHLIFDDGALSGTGEVFLEPPPLEGPANIRSATSAFTIASGMLVHGGGSFSSGNPNAPYISGIGSPTQAVTNNGSIVSDSPFNPAIWGPVLGIQSSSMSNNGTLGAIADHILDITGGVAVGSSGHMQSILSSTGNAGLIQITGNLNLSALTDKLDLAGFSDVFEPIITFTGTRTGIFGSVTAGYQVSYSGNQVLARSVPEPTSAASLLIGLLVIRRRHHV